MTSGPESANTSSDNRDRNCRTWQFKELFERLPSNIQRLAEDAFKEFHRDPYSPVLRNHPLDDLKKGRHEPGSRAVWINRQYRAIYVIVDSVNIWYWCGSHSDYDTFTGKK